MRDNRKPGGCKFESATGLPWEIRPATIRGVIREILVTLAFMAAVSVFGLPVAIAIVQILADLAHLVGDLFF